MSATTVSMNNDCSESSPTDTGEESLWWRWKKMNGTAADRIAAALECGSVVPIRSSGAQKGAAGGIYRHKYQLRAVFQSLAFLGLIGGTAIYNMFSPDSGSMFSVYSSVQEQRRLDDSGLQSCDDVEKVDPEWKLLLIAIGVLYMFLALAIVCDEFFVPALEEMSSNRRLNLPMDVAGATLMAAGGSAPELFSNLFGTFQESEIGFGTIIGSAVFNVLFVIAMCSVFAKETLELTWWPLFRDTVCYAVGLVVLTLFVGVFTKEEIVIWESIVLFLMYLVYIVIMWKNADLYKMITGKELVYAEEEEDEEEEEIKKGALRRELVLSTPTPPNTVPERAQDVEGMEDADPERPAVAKSSSSRSLHSSTGLGGLQVGVLTRGMSNSKISSYFSWQGTFRAGILKLMRDPSSWVETGGMGIVSKIAGDADHVFRQIDENGDGHLDREELKRLFEILDCRMSERDLNGVFDDLDLDKDGVICEDEFHRWYTRSAELIRSQVRQVFDELDTNNSGTIDKYELKALLLELDPRVTDKDVEDAIESMYKHGSTEEITFDEFEEWYEHSMIYERQKKMVEEDMEGVWESLKPPFGDGWATWLQYLVILPLVAAMAFTIPDVRRPGRSKYCYFAFALSIGWIGIFSYLMVTGAEMIGNTIGIPSVVMGLTVIAAGTSVPDLLSSVIVARRGSGDMAVSSSIGSNIFDILFGLPVPWFVYQIWPSKPNTISIGSNNIFYWIFILLGMLVFVISAVHFQGWKLTRQLGAMMMVFYVAFLVQAVFFELPFETCIETVVANLTPYP